MLLLASCSDQVPEIPSSELYTREWVKAFGVIDSRNDWNTATAGSINVNAPAGSNIKVTTRINGKSYLLANYSDVSGSRTLSFDMPRGVKDITVQCGKERVATTVGGHVSFGGSRAIWDDKTTDPLVSVTRAGYREISDKAVLSFGEYLPENIDNRGKVTQSFSYIANGPFTVYPVFWYTNAYNTLGIYYLKNEGTDDETMVFVPFYSNKIKREGLSDGNLEYIMESAVLPGIEAKDVACNWPFYIINDQPSEWLVNDKTSVGDFDEQDWADFKKLVCEKHGPFTTNYGTDFGYSHDLPQEMKDQLKIVDFDYTVTDEGWRYVITITNLHMSAAEGCLDERQWTYPGHNQISHPNFKEYYTMFEKGMKYDEIAATGTIDLPMRWRSEGIRIDIEPGTEFGMFIRTEGQGPAEESVKVREVKMVYNEELGYKVPDTEEDGFTRMFSQAKYNTDKMDTEENPGVKTVNCVHAATYKYPAPSGITYQVLAFEDWYNGDLDKLDLNDMIFFIDSDNPQEMPDIEDDDEPEPIKWLIACEDLGDKDDFDFNDVVFEVSHVAGENKAYILPLAAGGTLETYLMREDENGEHKQIGNEWHLNCGGKDFTTMINTTAFTFRPGKEHEIAIDVPEDFSITSDPDGAGYRKNMGGFYLRVKNEDGTETTEVTAPGAGEAPQMILLYQENGKWFWPVERTRINVAYRDFTEWATNPIYDVVTPGEKRWYHLRNDVHVIKR